MASSQPEAPARKLRWFQYSLRSLMLLVLVVSLGMSWVAVKIKRARQQERAVEELRKSGVYVWYDYQVEQSGKAPYTGPPGPAWLRNLLGENFFATLVGGNFASPSVTDANLESLEELTQLRDLNLNGTQVTDAGLKHLKGLTHLQKLYLSFTQVTDAGLEHLEGLSQLQTLDLSVTRVTDEGVKRLQQALPNCEIER